MRLILLSGGSGKRLWPLSSDVRSKQFLKLLPAPGGGTESMVQRIDRQIRSSVLGECCSSVTVAAGEIQLEQLRLQLGADTDIVAEPARRDTFLAIALATAYLKDVKGADDDETVVCMPVDSFVDDGYFDRLALIESELAETGADIVLIGARPSFPSEKFGYIVPAREATHDGQGARASLPVESFKEKPAAEEAAALIERGALWNCGVFGFRLGYLLDIVKKELLTESPNSSLYQTLRASFADLRRRSFDYEVVEKARSIRVIPYEGAWKDLGSWETFTEEIGVRTMGNVYLDAAAEGTHVLNELDLPVVVMGARDCVVVSNHEGILVSPKGDTYRLKEAVEHIGGRPMQEERRWGKYIVLDYSEAAEQADGSDGAEAECEYLTKRLTLLPGKLISYQSHAHRKEIWTVVRGRGTLYLNGEKSRVAAGDTVIIAEGEKHGIKAETTLEIIEVQIGDKLTEDDITRYEMAW
jgi:mannose-1-phosphate guanylyltransferase